MDKTKERKADEPIESMAEETMQRRDNTLKTILVTVASLLAILGLAGGGFLVYQVMQSSQESNNLNYPGTNRENLTSIHLPVR